MTELKNQTALRENVVLMQGNEACALGAHQGWGFLFWRLSYYAQYRNCRVHSQGVSQAGALFYANGG